MSSYAVAKVAAAQNGIGIGFVLSEMVAAAKLFPMVFAICSAISYAIGLPTAELLHSMRDSGKIGFGASRFASLAFGSGLGTFLGLAFGADWEKTAVLSSAFGLGLLFDVALHAELSGENDWRKK